MKAIGKNLIVIPLKAEKGVIETPATVLETHAKAEVLELGTGVSGFDFEVKVGDIVIIDLRMAIPISWTKDHDDKRMVVDHDDILGRHE